MGIRSEFGVPLIWISVRVGYCSNKKALEKGIPEGHTGSLKAEWGRVKGHSCTFFLRWRLDKIQKVHRAL